MRYLGLTMSVWMLFIGACGDDAAPAGLRGSEENGHEGGRGGRGGSGGHRAAPNADGDCMSDAEEIAFGTDPTKVDTDGDGLSDCEERDCVSDATDPSEICYACGWPHNDPGTLKSTGKAIGDVVKNLPLVDQCGETVQLWDFAREYHILYLTASW